MTSPNDPRRNATPLPSRPRHHHHHHHPYHRRDDNTPPPPPSSSSHQTNGTRRLYNDQARQCARVDPRHAQAARRDGEALVLKDYHNRIKTLLLARWLRGPRLLDLCCGKGGDIHKWRRHPTLRHVCAVDVSGDSVAEARRRWDAACGGGGGRGQGRVTVDWHVADVSVPWTTTTPVAADSVSCMFALHYFAESSATLDAVLATAARYVRPGGFFFGCWTDGRSVSEVAPLYGRLLDVTVEGDDESAAASADSAGLGRRVTCRIGDTVTDDTSREFRLEPATLVAAARRHGFEPVTSDEAWGPDLVAALGEGGWCRRFRPSFREPTELVQASRLFSAFSFQRVGGRGVEHVH